MQVAASGGGYGDAACRCRRERGRTHHLVGAHRGRCRCEAYHGADWRTGGRGAWVAAHAHRASGVRRRLWAVVGTGAAHGHWHVHCGRCARGGAAHVRLRGRRAHRAARASACAARDAVVDRAYRAGGVHGHREVHARAGVGCCVHRLCAAAARTAPAFRRAAVARARWHGLCQGGVARCAAAVGHGDPVDQFVARVDELARRGRCAVDRGQCLARDQARWRFNNRRRACTTICAI